MRANNERYQVPAEVAINKAMTEVECLGPCPKLTDAISLLQSAKNLVSHSVNDVIAFEDDILEHSKHLREDDEHK